MQNHIETLFLVISACIVSGMIGWTLAKMQTPPPPTLPKFRKKKTTRFVSK